MIADRLKCGYYSIKHDSLLGYRDINVVKGGETEK
jgi:hypothetical protein